MIDSKEIWYFNLLRQHLIITELCNNKRLFCILLRLLSLRKLVKSLNFGWGEQSSRSAVLYTKSKKKKKKKKRAEKKETATTEKTRRVKNLMLLEYYIWQGRSCSRSAICNLFLKLRFAFVFIKHIKSILGTSETYLLDSLTLHVD